MITNSTMCSIFPLAVFLDKVPTNSYANYWINMHPNFVVGLTDLRARFGTFTTPWNAVSPFRSPLPDLTIPESRSLAELMDLRGYEIYKESVRTNKKIMIMWSGGIDSTSVIVSILKAVPFNEQADRLVICLSPDSVLENLYFYKKFISEKIPTVHRLSIDLSNSLLEQYIILNGDPGDALFGPSSGKYQQLIANNEHRLPIKSNRDKLYACLNNNLYSNDIGTWLVDKIIDNIEESKLDLCLSDWFWWQYINFKWEGSLWRPFHGTSLRKDHKQPIKPKNSLDYLNTVFFNTDYFQRWSYTNLPNLFPKGIESHKWEIKEYIYNFDGNINYQKNKIKITSMPLHLINGLEKNYWASPVYHDENWIGYNLKDPGVYDTCLELLKQYNG
jgi:hypothetical protein